MLKRQNINSPECVNLPFIGLDYTPHVRGFIFSTMKKCTKCGDLKEVSEFSKDKSRKDGFQTSCKICRNYNYGLYLKSKIGVITQIYNHQKLHSISRGHKPPTYKRGDLIIFALASPEFHVLYNNWTESNYNSDLKPSFDRADDTKGYSFDNFNKWMIFRDNYKKAHSDVRSDKLKNSGLFNGGHKKVVGFNHKTGKSFEFISLMNAERNTGANHSHISACCKGKRNFAGGYSWTYKK